MQARIFINSLRTRRGSLDGRAESRASGADHQDVVLEGLNIGDRGH